MEVAAQRRAAASASPKRHHRIGGERLQPLQRLARRSPSACATSSVKLSTQPSVTCGAKPEAVRDGRRD